MWIKPNWIEFILSDVVLEYLYVRRLGGVEQLSKPSFEAGVKSAWNKVTLNLLF